LTEISIFLDIIEDSLVFLHHDSITGTAKRKVDDDYFKRIQQLQNRIKVIFENYLNTNVKI
jgi:hypothetical protein